MTNFWDPYYTKFCVVAGHVTVGPNCLKNWTAEKREAVLGQKLLAYTVHQQIIQMVSSEQMDVVPKPSANIPLSPHCPETSLLFQPSSFCIYQYDIKITECLCMRKHLLYRKILCLFQGMNFMRDTGFILEKI